MILSFLVLLLLPTASYSLYEKTKTHIKTTTLVSKIFEMGPGLVATKTFENIKFLKGRVIIKSFDAELVDQEGNFIPFI